MLAHPKTLEEEIHLCVFFKAALLLKVTVADVVALVLPGEVDVLLAVPVRPPGVVHNVLSYSTPERGKRAVVEEGLDAGLGELDEGLQLCGRHRLVRCSVDIGHIFLVTA